MWAGRYVVEQSPGHAGHAEPLAQSRDHGEGEDEEGPAGAPVAAGYVTSDIKQRTQDLADRKSVV